MARYYGFMVDVCVSVRSSICILFTDDNELNINGFSPNLVCALILW